MHGPLRTEEHKDVSSRNQRQKDGTCSLQLFVRSVRAILVGCFFFTFFFLFFFPFIFYLGYKVFLSREKKMSFIVEL